MNLARVAIITLAGCGTIEPVTPTNHAVATDREAQMVGTWVRRSHASSPEGGTEGVTTSTVTWTPGHWTFVNESASRKLGNSRPWITEPAFRSESPSELTASGLVVELDHDTHDTMVCAPATIYVATPHALRLTDGESSPGKWSPPDETPMQVLQCTKPHCEEVEDAAWLCHTDFARSPGIELGCVSLAGCGYRRMTSAAIVPLMDCNDPYNDC